MFILDYTEGNKKYHWHIEIIPRLTEIDGFEWGTGFILTLLLQKRQLGS